MPVLRTLTLGAALLLLTAVGLSAQVAPPIDVAGTWHIQATAFFAPPAAGDAGPVARGVVLATCNFEGLATIQQDGTSISGDATLNLTSGDQDCPPEMMATLTGTVNGDLLEMGLLMGGRQFGEATFTGGPAKVVVTGGDRQEVQAQPAPIAVMAPPQGLAGGFAVTAGPFVGAGGSWTAIMRLGAPAIPTVSAIGLTLLVFLIFGAGFLLLRR